MCLNSGIQAIDRLTHETGTYVPHTYQIGLHMSEYNNMTHGTLLTQTYDSESTGHLTDSYLEP